MDYNDTRRGSPAAHVVYGVPLVVHSAHYIFFAAIGRIIRTYPRHLALEALTIFYSGFGRYFFGTGEELYRRESQLCPNEEEYMVNGRDKTGGPVVFYGRLQELLSKEREKYNFGHVQELFGLYFQLHDDYKNLVDKEVSCCILIGPNNHQMAPPLSLIARKIERLC